MINKVINKAKFPIKIWATDVDSGTIDQATTLANVMPIHSHVALMPDTHLGFGMPIGGVLPLINAISPYCVGADIGCGMMAIKTNLTELDFEVHKLIRAQIRRDIPVGFKSHETFRDLNLLTETPNSEVIVNNWDKARSQIGTLGGGNHFIEIQKGSDGHIWIMIHSGSRNVGKQTADYYHKLAIESGTVPNGIKELAYFDMNTLGSAQYILGNEYYDAMNWCLEYALENRDQMSIKVLGAFEKHLGTSVQILDEVNIHHNYAASEEHYGERVIVHRKGATLASEGTMGIIPGSMGAKSYIVRGKGNEESFNSCSHGAGRVMSRSKAKKTISDDDYTKSLTDIGLDVTEERIHKDEAPGAYKCIDTVMKNQVDLVDKVVELIPYQFPAIKG